MLAACLVLAAGVLPSGAGTPPTASGDSPLERPSAPIAVPETLQRTAEAVPEARLQSVFEAVKTPHKHGIVLRGEPGEKVDCPSVFRADDRWYMLFVSIHDDRGYETWLAESEDLLEWKRLGRILPFAGEGWDAWQANGRASLVDHQWGGSMALQAYDDRYWLTYVGGALQGYETDPLSIGVASTRHPTRAEPWERYAHNPVLAPHQPDVRPFEAKTLYTSHVIWDREENIGWPFVMYYNGKDAGPGGHERIGMAVSRDMRVWHRYGEPIIYHGEGSRWSIDGNPQVVRMGDLWVMFYFGAFWRPGAFNTFACSYDMVHWTEWTGPDLIAPSESWDEQFAHKPWLLRHEGVVYHFYCAVGDEGRVIALATSEDLARGASGAD